MGLMCLVVLSTAPGEPVKYVELNSTGVSFADADVSIHYTDAELKGLDDKSLVIYSYYGGHGMNCLRRSILRKMS